MNPKQFEKARKLNNEMYQVKRDIEDIDNILNADKIQVSIQITVDTWSRSFGGKKYDMIGQVKLGLIGLRADLEKKLNDLQEQFDIL